MAVELPGGGSLDQRPDRNDLHTRSRRYRYLDLESSLQREKPGWPAGFQNRT